MLITLLSLLAGPSTDSTTAAKVVSAVVESVEPPTGERGRWGRCDGGGRAEEAAAAAAGGRRVPHHIILRQSL